MPDRLAIASPGPTDSDSPPHDMSSELDFLLLPPLDSMSFSDFNTNAGVNLPSRPLISDPGFGLEFEDIGEFEFTLDDLDDLYLPSETEDFLLPEGIDHYSGLLESPISPADQHPHVKSDTGFNSQPFGDCVAIVSYSPFQDSGNSGCSADQCTQVEDSAKCSSSNSENFNHKCSSTNSCDFNSSASLILNHPSPEHGCDHELSGGPVSSQSSGSGKYDTFALSHALDNYNATVGQKIKVEETSIPGGPKRRNEQDEGQVESRTTKYQRSLTQIDDGNTPFGLGSANEEGEKRKARLTRNRESAQLSRQRKKHYVEELELKVRMMNSTIADLNTRMSYIMAENAGLRQQLGSDGGICQALPPPGLYLHPPSTSMSYPWMPYPPYVVKQLGGEGKVRRIVHEERVKGTGTQVPLVPIPKLKPQQPAPAKTKKNEVTKSKKVASVSLLGLLSFIFLFGVLLPSVNVQYKSTDYHVPRASSSYYGDGLYDEHKGRTLLEYAHLNDSKGNTGYLPGRKLDVSERIPFNMKYAHHQVAVSSGLGEFASRENSSEPLVASLYVPRNDKLVKIDGNLIIHSVLASEKAMATCNASEMKNKSEGTLAIADGRTLAIPDVGRNGRRHPNIYRTQGERHKALTSGTADTLKDHMKSPAADGKLQQWFREGLAGPLLSSGTCNEVFQFDISPAPVSGAIITEPTIPDASLKRCQKNANRTKIENNRRALGRLPVPLFNSSFNTTEECMGRSSHNENFQWNKSASSMVVSVLVDPREAGSDGDVDEEMITPKALSRIFVVVLVDKVKYVTYSCMLPGSAPHPVTS